MTNTNQLNTEVNEIAVVDEQVNKNDIVTVDKVTPNIFAADGSKEVFFSSIQATDRKSAVKMYNAINSSENALADHRGEVLQITDMVAHAITLEDEVTKILSHAYN
ncbi:hypothetical protein ACJS9P_16820 [Bacillus cereus]